MAGTSSKKKSSSSNKKKNTKKTNSRSTKKKNVDHISFVKNEIILLVTLAISILLLISNFGLGGTVGNKISSLFFGIFGFMSYAFPFVLFICVAFGISNKRNAVAIIKLIASVVFYTCICSFLELIFVEYDVSKAFLDYYRYSIANKSGGGIVGGTLIKLLVPAFGVVGTYVIICIVVIICLVIVTERSFLNGLRKGSSKVIHTAKEDAARRKEKAEIRREQQAEEKAARKDNIVRGVALDTAITRKSKKPENIHEILPSAKSRVNVNKRASDEVAMSEFVEIPLEEESADSANTPIIQTDFPIKRASSTEADFSAQEMYEIFAPEEKNTEYPQADIVDSRMPEEAACSDTKNTRKAVKNPKSGEEEIRAGILDTDKTIAAQAQMVTPKKEYVFPPLKLLKKGTKGSQGDSDKYLRETAKKLQQTLHNFGVNVTITNISCGPSVTRYELQPEQGVKVSKIVNLTDDIKLNLAAADIRIEAPIPGKAAVGIEVPNKENSAVMFRDLIESKEFKTSPSNLAFAAGKNIGGQVIVTDIAKMPHLLIAGATGSGKSVCINTIIMSIMYKAKPEDVKLIMIDPKVVELSVYNGIPHLLIPVVTDPKKAAGALNWGVAEMDERYNKFAEYNVRDLKGYNAKIESIADIEDENKPEKLPQIVIIVDELADLMMVAPGEVENSICRLAQLARAAGIHLIIATQRPSVNVITGLIKANMPSRIAFSVSSGVDSRTIIDMNGAEKLLGKGDMLFYPQGFQKPERLQGAFISDKEVFDVVEFLKSQNEMMEYNPAIEEKMNTQTQPSMESDGTKNERDAYFVEAGKFIIEKDKASIGMLQRMFKVGFNRAARIMDQLADAGVVGEEEGTKPRKILMSIEEFELYIDEYV